MQNDCVERFWKLLSEENKVQNLTSDEDRAVFEHKHVRDVVELEKSGFLDYPALDLGSGGGIPGLLHAAMYKRGIWVLAESENRKADFLTRAAVVLGVADRVTVYAGRAEDYLRDNEVSTVCVRAVGTVEKIYGLIRKCSTWNSLVLLKGPKWESEYSEFSRTGKGKELTLAATHAYQLSEGDPTRIITKLDRRAK